MQKRRIEEKKQEGEEPNDRGTRCRKYRINMYTGYAKLPKISIVSAEYKQQALVSILPHVHTANQRPPWRPRPLLRRYSFPILSLLLVSNSFLGASYKGSVYEQNPWLSVAVYSAMTMSACLLRDKSDWLDLADHAIDLVPKVMRCLYKVP